MLGDATLAQIVFKGNLTGSVFSTIASSTNAGIMTSGSYFQQGTLAVSATVDGNQTPYSGGTLFPIVDGNGFITEVVFSASGENYQAGDVISITTSSMAVLGYTSGIPGNADPIALRIIVPQDNIQNQSTRNIYQSPNTIQMVTASNILSGEETFGFLLSGSNTSGSDGTFLVPFAQEFLKQ